MSLTSRRGFLKTAGAVAAAACAGVDRLSARTLNKPVGLQLYSVREQLPKDLMERCTNFMRRATRWWRRGGVTSAAPRRIFARAWTGPCSNLRFFFSYHESVRMSSHGTEAINTRCSGGFRYFIYYLNFPHVRTANG